MSEPGTRLCGGDGGRGLANRPFKRTPQVSIALSNLLDRTPKRFGGYVP